MVEARDRFTVNNADIGEMSARIGRFLARERLEEREIRRLRLTMERLLRRVSERRGWGTPCELAMGRRPGGCFVQISWPGEAFDPVAVGREGAGNGWSVRLLTDLGLIPEWSFRAGVNRLVLRPRGRRGCAFAFSLLALAIAALAALALGALPPSWAEGAERLVLAPLADAITGALCTLVSLTVFFGAAARVVGAVETLPAGAAGRRAVFRSAGLTGLWAALGTAVAALLFTPAPAESAAMEGIAADGIAAESAAAESMAEGLSAFSWSLIPRDPVSPFFGVDLVQLGVLGAALGAALVLLGERTGRVREWTEQCASLLTAATEGVCRLSPAFVGVLTLRALCGGSAAGWTRLWAPFAVFALLALAALAFQLLTAAVTRRGGPARMLRSAAPAARLALRTASSAAAFGKSMDACENELGLPHEGILLGLPVAWALCAPIAALGYPAAAIFLAAEASAPLGANALAALVLSGMLLALVLPASPGIFLAGFAALSTYLGLPGETLAAAAVLSVAVESLTAALSAVYLQWELLLQTGRTGAPDAAPRR